MGTWVRVSVLLRTVPQCPFKPTLKLSNIGARTVLVWETDIQMYYAHSLYRLIGRWIQLPDPLLASKWFHLLIESPLKPILVAICNDPIIFKRTKQLFFKQL